MVSLIFLKALKMSILNHLFVFLNNVSLTILFRNGPRACKQTMFLLLMYISKNNLHYESYLDLLPSSLRMFFCRLRLSVHPLRIQTGRYGRNRIARDQRYCLFCNSHDIEDEYHFMLICPFLEEIRKKYMYQSIITNAHQCLNFWKCWALITKPN